MPTVSKIRLMYYQLGWCSQQCSFMSLFAQISDYYILGLSRLGSLDHNPCIREKSKLPSNLLKHDDSSVLNYYSKIVNQCPPVFQLWKWRVYIIHTVHLL